MKNFLTTKEVAQRVGCHPSTVAKYCSDGIIEAEKVGFQWHIDPDSAEKFITTYDPKAALKKRDEERRGAQSRFYPHSRTNLDEVIQRLEPAHLATLAHIRSMGKR